MSVPNTTLLSVLQGTFWIGDRSTNWFSWLAVVLLFAVPVSIKLLSRLHAKKQYDILFATLVDKHKSRAIKQYNAVAWGDALSLQTCPELSRGWELATVRLEHDTTRFPLPNRYLSAYKDYFERYKEEKRFFNDGVKYMIVKNPIAFSDSTHLVLHTRETRYSEVQFYRDNVATLASERDALIAKAISGNIEFPHSLCMHLVVVTSDDKVLLTKRSDKVAYYPAMWSCSVEEQLASQDMDSDKQRAMSRWGDRFLLEELGLRNEVYNANNFRILSVFLETDSLNISLCAHVVLNVHSNELGQILRGLPRTDYEFTDWVLLSHEELLTELFDPTRPHHPTTAYRMLLALIRRYGEPVVAEKFFRHK